MWMTNNTRFVRILLLVLFACGSLASPSLFVLCTGDGGVARIVPFHIAHNACAVESAHACAQLGGSATEITHHHVRCTNFSLSGHLGLVKERERLPDLLCLWSSASIAGNSDLRATNVSGGPEYPAPVSNAANHFPDSELESVVLII
jgi:hypothetical protein